MGDIVCKFGGTSLADADCVRRAVAIIEADPRRRFIVPSAPGKRNPEDKKITDLLYAWYSIAEQGLNPSEPRDMILARFRELAGELKVSIDLEGLLAEISAEVESSSSLSKDFMASRGEYLNGKLIAALLSAEFIDPSECVFLDEEGPHFARNL